LPFVNSFWQSFEKKSITEATGERRQEDIALSVKILTGMHFLVRHAFFEMTKKRIQVNNIDIFL
jgi:hypothetical protein